MDSLTSDGFVVTVHYRVTAIDGDYQSATYGTISYTKTKGETYIPYANLTQDIVVGWVQTSLGKTNVESSLQGQINALQNPVQIAGVPWAQ